MKIRVLTLNIRCDMGMDGDFNWQHRCQRVYSLIRNSGADLVALQEVLPSQRQAVEENLAVYHWLGRGRQFGGGGEQCAIGVSPHLQVRKQGTFWLSETPELEGTLGWDACLPRICTWAEVGLGEASFIFANTHFDHLGAEARLQSAKLLSSRFEGKSVVLAGDFNSEPGKEPIDELSRYFEDVLDLAEETTYQEFGSLPNGPRIDYIWTSPDVRLESANVVPEFEPYCSDHFAIVADLEVS